MKYEFTGETRPLDGVTLKRIRAVTAIERYLVKAGDLGGWIEREDNLAQNGDAWVTGNARVTDNAVVRGDAWVGCDAVVSDGAVVTGHAVMDGTNR